MDHIIVEGTYPKSTVETPVSRSTYSNIFHTMNLSFKHPSIDTCKCDTEQFLMKEECTHLSRSKFCQHHCCLQTLYFKNVSYLYTISHFMTATPTNQLHEGEGGHGATRIATCLFSFLQSLPENIKEDIFYSDNCNGQNKNSYAAAMFISAMSRRNTLNAIHHKFLVPAHTHLECDVIHAMIERKRKTSCMEIHLPRDWYALVRSTGKKLSIEVEF
ncbi:hypothetical protein PR048_025331 [Dryococelus australis]|uniref:DUF7869 domain-containing protein n=1 Tax=Dryococelus australis TaxID=614101 RepID=A0ABQ9GR25_9NEOP|nr:hypothetical protein PR048_025331 [Dryococelus australis]